MAVISAISITLYGTNILGPTPPPPPAPPVITTPPDKTPVTPVNPPPIDTPPVKPPVTPPTPTPILPSPISTGVSVTDAKGNPLGNSIDVGRLFKVSASTETVLTPVPDSETDVDVIADPAIHNTFIGCFKVAGKKLQMVVAVPGSKSTIIAIQCNHGAQPPPVVVPVLPPSPINPPTPAPTVTGKVTIGIVEADGANRPLPVSKVLSDVGLWQKYRTAGHTVRMFNGSTTTPDTSPSAQADISALKSANVPLPGVVIRSQNGTILATVPLPTDIGAISNLLTPYTGVSP